MAVRRLSCLNKKGKINMKKQKKIRGSVPKEALIILLLENNKRRELIN